MGSYEDEVNTPSQNVSVVEPPVDNEPYVGVGPARATMGIRRMIWVTS